MFRQSSRASTVSSSVNGRGTPLRDNIDEKYEKQAVVSTRRVPPLALSTPSCIHRSSLQQRPADGKEADPTSRACAKLSTAVSTRRTVATTRSHSVSARFDSSIVYLLDECLTRGIYSLFAKWFVSYLRDHDIPGCAVVIGYTDEYTRRRGGWRERRAVTAAAAAKSSDDSSSFGAIFNEDNSADSCCCDEDEDEPPYVRIDPTEQFPIFTLKRQLNYPTCTILVTVHTSRMERTLNCDGCIVLRPRERLQRSMERVSEILSYLTSKYLNHYTDFARCDHANDDIRKQQETQQAESRPLRHRRPSISSTVSMTSYHRGDGGGGNDSDGGNVDENNDIVDAIDERSDDALLPTTSKVESDRNTNEIRPNGQKEYSDAPVAYDHDYFFARSDNNNDNSELYRFLMRNTPSVSNGTYTERGRPDNDDNERTASTNVDSLIVARNAKMLRELRETDIAQRQDRANHNISIVFDASDNPLNNHVVDSALGQR